MFFNTTNAKVSQITVRKKHNKAGSGGCVKSPIIEAVIANEVKQSVKIQIDCFSRPSFAMTGERRFTQPLFVFLTSCAW